MKTATIYRFPHDGDGCYLDDPFPADPLGAAPPERRRRRGPFWAALLAMLAPWIIAAMIVIAHRRR